MEWKKWFAWFPVKIGGEWFWLERIERRVWTEPCGDPYAEHSIKRCEYRPTGG